MMNGDAFFTRVQTYEYSVAMNEDGVNFLALLFDLKTTFSTIATDCKEMHPRLKFHSELRRLVMNVHESLSAVERFIEEQEELRSEYTDEGIAQLPMYSQESKEVQGE
jgi:hypothetical protein